MKPRPLQRLRWERIRQQLAGPGEALVSIVAASAIGQTGCTLTSDDYLPDTVGSEPPAAVSEPDPSEEAPSDETRSPEPATSAPGRGAAPVRGTEGNPPILSTPATSASPTENPNPGSDEPPTVEGSEEGASPTLPRLPALVGWASMPGRGLAMTSGGGAAPAIVARSATELSELAGSPEPLTIAIAGTLDVGRVDLTSNKTLIGIGADATLLGGISIRGTANAFVENVIVANLNVAAATSLVDGDGIQVRFAHHVWVDHCALRDAADGLLDIVHGSDFVTVSNTRFFYTADAPAPNHRFAALIGHNGQNGAEDAGHLNVTWHHNWWGEGVDQALLGRFGRIHMFNNLFRSPGGLSVLTAARQSSFRLESNHFESVSNPHRVLPDVLASLAAIENVYVAATGADDTTGAAFEPPYPYDTDSVLAVEELVVTESGPR